MTDAAEARREERLPWTAPKVETAELRRTALSIHHTGLAEGANSLS